MLKHQQKGLTLIEMLIALVLSLLVTGMVISMFTSSIGGHAQAIRTMRLNQDLRIAMDMMVRDIRRAGYWAGTNVASNPHATALSGGLPISITGSNCVVVSYDLDGDSDTSVEEFFGYRLNGLELETTKSSSATGTQPDCTGTFSAGWEDLLDTNTVQIDTLTFETYPALAASFAASPNKTVLITLEGTSRLDPNIKTVLSEEVRVRNEF